MTCFTCGCSIHLATAEAADREAADVHGDATTSAAADPFVVAMKGIATRQAAEAADREAAAALDVEALRAAIYEVSQRHDWEHSVDRVDRTEEIAVAYAAVLKERTG